MLPCKRPFENVYNSVFKKTLNMMSAVNVSRICVLQIFQKVCKFGLKMFSAFKAYTLGIC